MMKSIQLFFTFIMLLSATPGWSGPTDPLSGERYAQAPARTFQRSDLEACAQRYGNVLGISDSQELQRVCANYKNENLDCAVAVIRQYGDRDHRSAIKICIMEFSEPRLRSCALGKMNEVQAQGRQVNITASIEDCRKPAPAPSTQPAPQPLPQPTRRYTEPQYYGGLTGKIVDGKINRADVGVAIMQWLNLGANKVRDLESESYFGLLDERLENLAISMGREVKLYKVSFFAAKKEVICTATDFAPNYKDANRYLTLHECTVNGQHGALSAQFGALNYSFINGLSPQFKERMKKAEQEWNGQGNINFRKEVSDFLVIGY